MTHRKFALLAASGVAALFMITAPVAADPVTVAKIGTWSTTPTGLPNPGALARGGKFVISANYDTADILPLPLPTEADRSNGLGGPIDPARYFRAQLTTPASFQLHVPLQGLGIVDSSQNATTHYDINVDCGFPCGFARTAEIQFFDLAGTKFRGFEFESDFMAGNLVFEMFTADVLNSATRVTNSTAQILAPGLAGVSIRSSTADVLSEDAGPSGGQTNRGVFLSDAVPVVAKAGANLAYSASTLTVTTDAGTATVVDPVNPPVAGVVRTAPSANDAQPRQADNDLGAGRTDGEDFLNYAWSIQGGGALVGTNATGTRINRVVQDSANGPVFVNDGMRTVNDVNKSVGIVASGLTMTTDVKTWVVNVVEHITGKTSSDTLTVSYTNALPTIANATATASGPGNLDLNFALLGIDDADLAVNASIFAFEQLMKEIFVNGVDASGFFSDLILTDAQSVGNAALVSQFGLGNHTFLARVTDRAGSVAEATFDFTVLAAPVGTVPEPSSLALIGVAVAGLVIATRRRPPAGKRA